MREALIIVDMQYGSTGKGAIAGALGMQFEPDTVVNANHPNAGHTFWFQDQKFVNTVLPSTAVLPSVSNILLGPGSIFSLKALEQELEIGARFYTGKHLIVHPAAALVWDVHVEREKPLVIIGSTMKGSAEAAIHKMRRFAYDTSNLVRDSANIITQELGPVCTEHGIGLTLTNETLYNDVVQGSKRMIVEGAQGFSLGIHNSRFYPHTTSRDVSVNQLLADCRLPHSCDWMRVVGTMRTFPIRVANRLNEAGEQVGTSGDHYPDQEEITWESINREPELTTVTKLQRRIFSFSLMQIVDACALNQPSALALTFCDYMTHANLERIVMMVEQSTGVPVKLFSYGPRPKDVVAGWANRPLTPGVINNLGWP